MCSSDLTNNMDDKQFEQLQASVKTLAEGQTAILKRIIVSNHNVTGSATNYLANFGRKDSDLAAGSYSAQTKSVNATEDAVIVELASTPGVGEPGGA
mgnify:CR=1 FL=1